MKKQLLYTFTFFYSISLLAQELPINFSQASHLFNLTSNTNSAAEFNLGVDPTDSSNDVGEIVSSGYTDGFELELSTFIDVTNSSNNSISFDYYNDIAIARNGILTLDDEQYGNSSVSLSFTTSGIIGWETITLDFDDVTSAYLGHYGKIIIYLSGDNIPTGNVCYIDNIMGAQNGGAYNNFDGDAILTSQQEVNDFGAMGYSKVTGSLKIISNVAGTSTDIYDLTPLSSIYLVGNNSNVTSLEIIDNNNLTNLDGLNHIKYVYGSLIIKNNSSLNTLSHLSELNEIYYDIWVQFGEFTIDNNDALTSLNGLENLNQFPADLSIINNDALLSISNLKIGSDEIIIENNPSLQSISNLDFASNNTTVGLFLIKDNSNLSSISSVIGTVFISGQLIIDNSGLSNLSGLENLQMGVGFFSPNEGVILKNNNNLTSLNGLNTNLAYLGGIELDNNPILSDITLLSNFSSGGFLRFKNSPSISNLNSLSPVNSCREIVVEGTNGFTNLSGLENLNCDSNVHILNSNLTDISQLGLSDYLFSVRIEGNQSINNLTVFSSLEIMDALNPVTFSIINNNQLTNLDGFENLHTLDGFFTIEDNDLLNNFCAFNTLFTTGTFSGTYNVNNNAYNPSQSQIADNSNCSLSIEDFDMSSVKIYPNPTTDFINIQSNFDINSVEIYSLHGQKVLLVENKKRIDISSLSEGIYFLKLKTVKGEITKKVVKH